MPSFSSIDWIGVDPSLWRVRLRLREDPSEELWRARLRRRRAEAPDSAVPEEPATAFAPFFGEGFWRRIAGEEGRVALFDSEGSLRWSLPEPAQGAFPLHASARLWVQELLPDGRPWHVYFAEPLLARAPHTPLRALSALAELLAASGEEARQESSAGEPRASAPRPRAPLPADHEAAAFAASLLLPDEPVERGRR
jgi:hypothetical protein